MNLAFSTNAYKKTSLESAIDSIASLGYAGVEIMADIPHAYPPDMPPDRIARIRDQLARTPPGPLQRQRLHPLRARRHLSSHLDRKRPRANRRSASSTPKTPSA